MADQVELLFQFKTDGAPQLDTVEKIVQQLGKSSALTGGQLNIAEAALSSLTKQGETATRALEMLAASSASVGKETANAAKALLEEATAATVAASASNVAATGIRSIGTSAGQTVSSVTAASAAIRGLEGSLNIRAAERFLTQFGSINTLLQGTFQIFGALAVAEFAVRGVEELTKFYNAMNPVIEAEKEYTRVVEESSKAIEQLHAKERQLYLDRVTRTQGTIAGLQAGLATPTDQAQINVAEVKMYTEQVSAAQKALRDSQARDAERAGALGGVASPATRAAQKELDTQQLQLQIAIERVKADGDEKAATAAELVEKVQQKRLDTAKAIRDIEKQIADIDERSLALRDRATYGTGPFGSIVNAQRAGDRAAQRELDAIEQQRQLDRQGGPNANHLSDSEYNRKAASVTTGQANDALARMLEFIDKIHDASQKAAEDFKKVQESAEKTAEALSKKSASDFSRDLEEKIKKEQDDTSKLRRAIDTSYQSDNDVLEQQFRKSSQLAQFGIPVGSTQGGVDAAMVAYQQRLQFIQEIAENEQHIADGVADAGAKQDAIERAHAKLVHDTGEAQLELESKLLELQHKRLEDARNDAGRVFDALIGGKNGIDNLLKSFATSQGRAIFQNVTQDLFGSTSTSLHGLVSQGSPLAGLLRGTVFEPSGTGAPIDKNTIALDGVSYNLDALTQMLARVGGFSGGGAGSLPFNTGSGSLLAKLGIFGSDTNGITGQGPLGGGNSYTDLPLDTGNDSNVLAGALGLTSKSTSPYASLAKDAGYAAAAVAGGYGVYQGIQQGGARGTLGAVGSALGAASLIPGPQQPFVMAAALIAGMVKGLLPDPKAAFDAAQNKVLNNDRFTTPDPLSNEFDLATGASATSIASRWSSSPVVAGSDTFNTNARGQTRVVVQNTFHINALDAPSVAQLFENNGQQIADVVSNRTRAGDPGMQIAINRVVFGPGAA